MADEVRGSDRLIAAFERQGAPESLIAFAKERLEQPATLRDLIDVTYEEATINTKILGVLVNLMAGKTVETQDAAGDLLSVMRAQADTIERLYQHAVGPDALKHYRR